MSNKTTFSLTILLIALAFSYIKLYMRWQVADNQLFDLRQNLKAFFKKENGTGEQTALYSIKEELEHHVKFSAKCDFLKDSEESGRRCLCGKNVLQKC